MQRGDATVSAATTSDRVDTHRPAMSVNEWINDLDTGLCKVGSVVRGDDETVGESSSCNEAVLDGHCTAGSTELREQLRPSKASLCLEWHTGESSHSFVEPLLQPCPAPAPGQQENSEPDLAEDDGIDGDLALVMPKPCDDARAGSGLGRLAEHLRVNEVFHRSSVDSDSTGTKNPFSGHPSNQSTTPSLTRALRRLRRY